MVSLPSVQQTALLIHDMHNDNLKPGGGNPSLQKTLDDPATQPFIDNNVRLLEAARKRGMTVFHTGHFLRKDAKDVAMGGPSAGFGTLRADTWGAEPIDELQPGPGEWLIRKGGGYSAFTGTALEKWCHRLGITHIIIGGAGTSAGVSSTVYATRERDFSCVVASDACNGVGSESFKAAMLNMGTFAQIATTEEVVQAILQIPEGATSPEPAKASR